MLLFWSLVCFGLAAGAMWFWFEDERLRRG